MQPEKGEGFLGQRIVVLPRTVVHAARDHPLLVGVLPTDAGLFPRAEGHLRRRPAGTGAAIFIYCARGAGWAEIDGRHHDVGRGDLLVVPPGEPHTYGASARRPWTIHWVHAAGDRVAAFLTALGTSAREPVARLGDDLHVLVLFEDVLRSLERGYTEVELLYASQALAHLLGALVLRRHQMPRRGGTAEQRVAEVLAFMRESLDQPLSVATLAGLAGWSPSHLAAVFRRQTGYAVHDYFVRLRMHRACRLLDTTAMSVKEIAAQMGYEDPLYFSRAFKAVNEVAPSRYRALRKG